MPFCGEPLVTTRRVCTEKEGVRFEDRDLDSLMNESPTCSRDSLRTILAIYPTLEWEAGSLDIKTAFLQGSDLTRHVFIKPPRKALLNVYGNSKRPCMSQGTLSTFLVTASWHYMSMIFFGPGVRFSKKLCWDTFMTNFF